MRLLSKSFFVFSLELFSRIGSYERIYHIADISVQKAIQRIESKTDAVIGNSVLRVVIGAYFFTSVARSYLASSIGGDLFRLLALLYIIKLCAEHLERLILVFKL